MNAYRLTSQLWSVSDFFETDRWHEIKNAYRRNRTPFSMQYDDRLLTSWSDTPDLQALVSDFTQPISELIGQKLLPQVAYVSVDLAGSSIMMHRLHPDIFVQVQIAMGEQSDYRMSFGFCHNTKINNDSDLDYQPITRITRHDVDIVEYAPNLASVYVNDPRGFVGMLGAVPPNSVREVLVLSYTKLY